MKNTRISLKELIKEKETKRKEFKSVEEELSKYKQKLFVELKNSILDSLDINSWKIVLNNSYSLCTFFPEQSCRIALHITSFKIISEDVCKSMLYEFSFLEDDLETIYENIQTIIKIFNI